MIKKSIVLNICLLNYLFGVSSLLLNKGVVDIGRTSSMTEVEVPMEYVYRDGSKTTVDNVVVYNDRIQSDLFDCETDFLGTETCPHEKTECPSFEEFSDGYSTVHHVTRSFTKICAAGHVKIGDRCYLDANNDGAIDQFNTYISNDTVNYSLTGECINISCNNGVLTVDSDQERWQYTASNYISNSTSDLYGPLFSGDDYRLTWGHSACSYGAKLRGYWTGTTRDNARARACIIKTVHQTPCPTNLSYVLESSQCFISSVCPDNTVPQSDGSCKMEYDWYSYHCTTDTTYYQTVWQARNAGSDCGNPTCTNGPTPTGNNCVRVSYSCPFDPNAKCGKTTVANVDCGDGYVWNANRCERLESFCGSSTYNGTLDICQDVTHYSKLCANPSDVYDVSLNKCIGGSLVCQNGNYDTVERVCYSDFQASCQSAGYSYDVSTQTCINGLEDICDPQYHYISSEEICKGEMTMCATGETYNETLKSCEKQSCGILGTTNLNSRCETSALCDGTLTSDGKCLPNQLQ